MWWLACYILSSHHLLHVTDSLSGIYRKWHSLLADGMLNISFMLPVVRYWLPDHRIAMKMASTAVNFLSVHPQPKGTISLSHIVQNQKVYTWLWVHASSKTSSSIITTSSSMPLILQKNYKSYNTLYHTITILSTVSGEIENRLITCALKSIQQA